MDNGWVKIHRKLLDNPLFRNSNYLHVWVWLLLNVTHRPTDVYFKGQRVTLKPGQITCGRHQISLATGVNEASVERALRSFLKEGMVEHQTSNKCSLITVKKWNEYQDSEQQTHSKRTASAQQTNTKQEVKKLRIKESESEGEVVADAPTPARLARDFFGDPSVQEPFIQSAASRGLPEGTAREEIGKFVLYWTEPSRNGKKQRWEREPTFEVSRRLATWMSRVKERAPQNSGEWICSLGTKHQKFQKCSCQPKRAENEYGFVPTN